MTDVIHTSDEIHVRLAHERLAKAASEGSFTTGSIELWEYSAANCAAAGMERANLAEARVRLLESILQASPCTCMTYGTLSYPPQPSDHSERHWCGRCRALGYDKNPEPKPAFVFPNQLVLK